MNVSDFFISETLEFNHKNEQSQPRKVEVKIMIS